MNHGASRNRIPVSVAALVILIGFLLYPGRRNSFLIVPAGAQTLRLAYFPNITHAPALIGMARGEFQNALGASVVIDPKVFNAGPEEMEALLAGEVDLGYVGPGPAVDTYFRSDGRALRIIAGVCSGGAALVARDGTQIASVSDLNGKRVAVPQLGGTQDISLRHFIAAEGLQSQEKGGTVQILPIKNPDLPALFKRGELDAAWAPEPWATRLIHDSRAHLVVEERDLWPEKAFATTVLIARKAYLDRHPKQVQAFLEAHLRTIAWVQHNPQEAQRVVNTELKRLVGKSLSAEVLKTSWGNVTFTEDPIRSSIETFVRASSAAGYLHSNNLNLAQLFDLNLLQQAQQQAAIHQAGAAHG